MDTIRTLYVDSTHASEKDGRYTYDLVGGISVPENSRVYVDNISFVNKFSAHIDDNSDELYVQTLSLIHI